MDMAPRSAQTGALELLGLVFLVKMIASKRPHHHFQVRVPALTDNQSNAVALLAQYSRKMPSAAVHMELAMLCPFTSTHLEIGHVKRDNNVWADQLSKKRLRGLMRGVARLVLMSSCSASWTC